MLRSGTDIECGGFMGKYAHALDKGVIIQQDFDDRIKLAFRMRVRLNHFDPKGPLDKTASSEACSQASQDAAREDAIQGSTLLENVGKVFPFDATKLSKLAVIGPNSDPSQAVAGNYGGHPCGFSGRCY